MIEYFRGENMNTKPKKSYDDMNNSYDDMTDEELIEEFRKGNSDAEEYLLYRYIGIAKKVVSSFYLIGAEKDDLLQEALLGLYKAIKEYNPDRNCSFKSYACVCIKRHIITVIRSSTRQKHNPLNNYVPFNILTYEDKEMYLPEKIINYNTDDPENIVVLKERDSIITYTVENRLSKFEKKVLSCYFSGMSYTEASNALNTDVKAIDNALQRIKKKMKSELKAECFY